jgi:hypothetical protein
MISKSRIEIIRSGLLDSEEYPRVDTKLYEEAVRVGIAGGLGIARTPQFSGRVENQWFPFRSPVPQTEQ